jgi:Concanavalin A-like lectin/glucanases superfamily
MEQAEPRQQIFPQIIISILIAVAVYLAYWTVEQGSNIKAGYASARVAVLPMTSSSANDSKIFVQDCNNKAAKNYAPLQVSDNQLTGIEFSYSTFIYISPDTDDGTAGYKSIFYKGYIDGPVPLVGPGVFVSSDNSSNGSPVLRIMMNTYDTWFNPIDVQQIPFRKWFHLAMVVRKNAMEVYINGNMSNKMKFKGTLPYQNYQPLVLFSSLKLSSNDYDNSSGTTVSKRGIPPGESFIVNGKFTGYVSNLYYFSYAMTYSEIQAMMNMGPSNVMDNTDMALPPYLIDSWWTDQRG